MTFLSFSGLLNETQYLDSLYINDVFSSILDLIFFSHPKVVDEDVINVSIFRSGTHVYNPLFSAQGGPASGMAPDVLLSVS